ncbi:M15 family metallopeptidase [Cytobacillus gottheilii]|uniref:M15 family metallopeptidase n=1 Tax=Cytobacillus gottheilii TaxID=859144 RepID=UPI003CEDC190
MLKYRKHRALEILALGGFVILILALLVNIASQGDGYSENDSVKEIKEHSLKNASNVLLKEVPESKPFVGELELPVHGATGYASVNLNLKDSPDPNSKTVDTIQAGEGFEIIKEEKDWWFVNRGESSGWVPHKYSLINLPDVIPSMIYNNTNTYASKFASSGKSIPYVSNRALYSGKTYNERLKKEEYIMPVLYSMSKKIYKAQQHALSEGNSLILYEGFRPLFVQNAVVEGLTELANNDAEVMKGINTAPWGITWFITNGVSNHQMGYGMDVSLAKVNSTKEVSIGDYTVNMIEDYTEYTMPTPIHELSGASAKFTSAVTSRNDTAWRNAVYTDSMNEAAINLQIYCTSAGLTPLASEWWHFNDLDARDETADNISTGDYFLVEVYSTSPAEK